MMKRMIPSIVTFLNLFCGFLSIYYSNQIGNNNLFALTISSMAIMLATIFDLLDGRLARILKVESNIGKELDSFSDLITFGLAPAFLFLNFFQYLLFQKGIVVSPVIIIVFSFIYTITAAMRLAMYNINTNPNEKVEYFTGMASTFAGISVAGLIGFNYIPTLVDDWWIKDFYLFQLPENLVFYAVFYLFFAFLMVSKVKYKKSSTMLFNFKGGIGYILYNVGFFVFLIFAFRYFIIVMVITYTIIPVFRIFKKKKA
ncbi:MAG TPA: hypothetical protein DHW82_07115 [Spirochaetia bacterium]|nr:hypothetical protein [Spirochaetia bacterium]